MAREAAAPLVTKALARSSEAPLQGPASAAMHSIALCHTWTRRCCLSLDQFASNIFNKDIAGCPSLSSCPMLLQHTPGFSRMRTCHQIKDKGSLPRHPSPHLPQFGWLARLAMRTWYPRAEGLGFRPGKESPILREKFLVEVPFRK